MFPRKATVFLLALAAFLLLSVTSAWAVEKFLGSKDSKESDEPQKYLPDYDKLVKGKEADWVYFPSGNLKSYKTVSVKEFDYNGKGPEVREAARDAKDYMEEWLDKQGYKVVKSGGDLVIEGNIFNAWEPHGAARAWGGWMANPGVGLEVIAKDSKGGIVAEVRHKSKGSTLHDAVENGLEDVTKDMVAGK